jgi:hypothetical protein
MRFRSRRPQIAVAGTATGMLLANIPVVFLAKAFSGRLPLKVIHYVASGLFIFTRAHGSGRAASPGPIPAIPRSTRFLVSGTRSALQGFLAGRPVKLVPH